MDNFLEKYHLPKLNQDQRNKLNQPITAKKIETIIKISQRNPRNKLFQHRILQDCQTRTNTNTPQIAPHSRN